MSRIDLALGERGRAAASRGHRYGTVGAAIDAVLNGSPESRQAPGESPLTTREGEIAALIAEGLSNRAIAERLVISPRTVDGHVERILAKLGFTSRAQVAAWAAMGGK